MTADRDTTKLHPALALTWQATLHTCGIIGIEVFMTEGLRSSARQLELYEQGRTKPGRIVTNARPGQSKHEYGNALDFAFVRRGGGDIYDGPWEVVGAIAKWQGKRLGVSIVWGGDWEGARVDRPHLELQV